MASCMGMIAKLTEEDPDSTTQTAEEGDEGCEAAGPLMLEAALKVDKVLARLQELQGALASAKPRRSPKRSPKRSLSSSSCSPKFGRSRSCVNRSPKCKQDVMRIHDVLRWSDDHSGHLPQETRETREEYLRKLCRSKTEVFSEQKRASEFHGEWKHWSAPAQVVHQVISEILSASRIVKEITDMVADCIQESDGDEKCTPVKLAKESSGTALLGKPLFKKKDPLHKFKVVLPIETSARKCTHVGPGSGAGLRQWQREALYPKSKPGPVLKSREQKQVTSIRKQMEAWRSPGQGLVKPKVTSGPPSLVKKVPQSCTTPSKAIMDPKSAPTVRLIPPMVKKVHPCRSPAPALWGIKGPPACSSRVNRIQSCSSTTTREPMTENNVCPSAIRKAQQYRSQSQAQLNTIRSSSGVRSTTRKATCRSPPQALVELNSNQVWSSTMGDAKEGEDHRTSPERQRKASVKENMNTTPSLASLPTKFPMEATEIKVPNKPWQLTNTRAVLFSNPTFAPASPPGARPMAEKLVTPAKGLKSASGSSSSSKKTAKGWLGQRLSRAHSESPDIARRLILSTRRFALTPAKSLPALISKLPSRRKSAPEQRNSVSHSISKSSGVKFGAELPLPPGRQAEIVNLRTASSCSAASCRLKEAPGEVTEKLTAPKSRQLQVLDSNAKPRCGVEKALHQAKKLSHGLEFETADLLCFTGSEKENVPRGVCAPRSILRRSWSTGDRLSMTKSSSTGQSFIKRAKDWVRTQTPFRDHRQRRIPVWS